MPFEKAILLNDPNRMPPEQGKRDKKRPNYNFIPLEFDNELASIFEEGRRPRPGMPEGYGDSWKAGGKDFLEDCLNHAFWHLKMYMRGDRSENHLAKVAWNVLVVKFHEQREFNEQNLQESQEVKRVNSSEEQNLQLSEVQEVSQQGIGKDILLNSFHEVGPRSISWLENQEKHDAIAEEVIKENIQC